MAQRRPDTLRAAGYRFEPELIARVRKEADARGVSQQWLITRLLNEGLDRLRPVEDFRLTRDD